MNPAFHVNQLKATDFQSIEVISNSWKRVGSIDLSAILNKLTDTHHGKGWEMDAAQKAEILYRCFLTLQVAYCDKHLPIVPFEEADEFWHQHILDTRKYMSDCDKLFGAYLHHFPYFGMRGDEDAKNLSEAGELTFLLFHHHFPEYANELIGKCSTCARCASCSAS